MPIRPEFRHFYRGSQWQATRAAIRERAGDCCEKCHAKNGTYVLRDTADTEPRELSLEDAAYLYRNERTRKRRQGFIELTEKDAAGLKVRGFHPIQIQCGCCHKNNVAGDDRRENLAWWCRGCHLRHDKPHHRNSRATRKDQARPLLAQAEART